MNQLIEQEEFCNHQPIQVFMNWIEQMAYGYIHLFNDLLRTRLRYGPQGWRGAYSNIPLLRKPKTPKPYGMPVLVQNYGVEGEEAKYLITTEVREELITKNLLCTRIWEIDLLNIWNSLRHGDRMGASI